MNNSGEPTTERKLTFKYLLGKFLKSLAFLLILLVIIISLVSAILYMKLISAEALSDTLGLNKVSIIDSGLKRIEDLISKSEHEEVKKPIVTLPVSPVKPRITNNETNNSDKQQQNNIVQNSNRKPASEFTFSEAKKKNDTAVAKNISKLARLYSAMKPEEAVAIMKLLDEQTIIKILSKMEEDQAAKILANFNADLAARITQKMIKGN